jgi:isopentenyl-diphosphate Delta-isomerase
MKLIDNDVILVDENDNVLGSMEKMQAHVEAKLHRAVSVFIFNSKGEWLLHQRAIEKYHSKGLWTNASCTHPAPGETTVDAANRRLSQEMGLTANLKHVHSFVYKASLENSLTEYEYDHVFVGMTDEIPQPHANEVMNYKYINYNDLLEKIQQMPNTYSAWFKIIVEQVGDIMNNNNNKTA